MLALTFPSLVLSWADVTGEPERRCSAVLSWPYITCDPHCQRADQAQQSSQNHCHNNCPHGFPSRGCRDLPRAPFRASGVWLCIPRFLWRCGE